MVKRRDGYEEMDMKRWRARDGEGGHSVADGN